jgi:hypothetical protein
MVNLKNFIKKLKMQLKLIIKITFYQLAQQKYLALILVKQKIKP